MSSEEEREVKRTSLFAKPDGVVEEGALEVDERVVDRSVFLDPPFVLSFDATEREGVECVRRALEQVGGGVIFGTEPVFDAEDEGEDTFMDVVGVGQGDEGAVFEAFTFTLPSCITICSQRLFWRVPSVHPSCQCASVYSSFSLVFSAEII